MTRSGDGVSALGNTEEAVTELIRRWVDGDAVAGDRLFTLVYDELRVVVRLQRRRWDGDDTLDTTALVHEVYLRLNAATSLSPRDRAHFYAVAARATRQVLSNYARARRALKRGDGAPIISLDGVNESGVTRSPVVEIQLDRLWDLEMALQALQALHPRPCQVVECRYFGGLSIPDTAIALGISEATVKRDWALAQAWLHRELRQHAMSDE